MSHVEARNYESISDMSPAEKKEKASWRKFYVIEAGKTNGAHVEIIDDLKRFGFTEVNSHDQCDYCVVICPIISRVGTDVAQALEKMPPGKPAILVVMHHTFDSTHPVPDRGSDNQDVQLTVHYLFHEGKLLRSNRNEMARFGIQGFLRESVDQISITGKIIKFVRNNPWIFIGGSVVVGLLIILSVVLTKLEEKP